MRGLRVEFDRETDGRWIADIPALPGVTVYGRTRKQALAAVETLALWVIADRIKHGEDVPRGMRLRAAILLATVALLLVPAARAIEPVPAIQLRATVEKATYCGSSEGETVSLQLRLLLRYRNVGEGPVILSRGSSLIPEAVVGKGQIEGIVSEKEESWTNTIYTGGSEPVYSDAWPNPAYVLLNAGEAFSTYGDLVVVFARKPSGYAVALQPGRHFLQFRAGAWSYSEESDARLRKAWQSRGYLWTKAVRSEPVQLTLDAHPKVRKCD
jgi:predicted RNase H-like HicB family nuclease